MFLLYFDNEELKLAGKNQLERLIQGREQSSFVEGLISLKKTEYQVGLQETETVISLFYCTKEKEFENDIYRLFIHFFPIDLIDIMNFISENEEDFCCFSVL